VIYFVAEVISEEVKERPTDQPVRSNPAFYLHM